MRSKALVAAGLVLVGITLVSCSSDPVNNLLKRYFNAVSLNDNATMSSMALEPIQPNLKSWQVVKKNPEETAPATLPELSRMEADSKKALEGHVGTTLDAQEQMNVAKDEYDSARTGAAKAAAKKKLDEATTKFEAEKQAHADLQKKYNDAKAAAAREEEITAFSLSARDLPDIRDLTGTVHSRTAEVKVTEKDGTVKTYNVLMRKYNLKSPSGVTHNGRWIIVRFEPIA